MAPRKLPPDLKMRHIGVSMPQGTWRRVQFIAQQRSPYTSASAILREAVEEYVARRFGPQPIPDVAAS